VVPGNGGVALTSDS